MKAVATKTVNDGAVLSKALLNAGQQLGLKREDIAQVVKRNRSRLGDGIQPDSGPGILALYLIRCYRSLYAIFNGNSEHIRLWMTGFNKGTGGVPIEQVKDVATLVHVMEYLDAMRGKV